MAVERSISTPSEEMESGTSPSNGILTVTLAAPGAGYRWVLTGWMISANGQPAAAVTATLTIQGAARPIQVPAVAFTAIPINMARGIRADINEAVVLTVPALGTGIVSSGWLLAYKERA